MSTFVEEDKNMDKQKVILLILDGWGYRKDTEHNAVLESNPVNFKSLMQDNKWTLIDASEERVGLPAGQMGNSEVGHTNIGAGRVVYQDLTYINKSIESGGFYSNEAINSVMDKVNADDATLHLMGLCSSGGVHSHIDHLSALLELAKRKKIRQVCNIFDT